MPLDLTPRGKADRGPELCAFHGDHCSMGARWPIPEPFAEMHNLFRNAAVQQGRPVKEPDPYTVDKHRLMNRAERRELAEAIAEQEARNEHRLAEIMAPDAEADSVPQTFRRGPQ